MSRAQLSPTPEKFDTFVKRVLQIAITPFDFGAEKLKTTKAPILFIHGDADGVRLEHVAEMFRLKGGGTHGDLGPRSESRLAILPDTTHVTLMNKMDVIVPMVNDFLNAPSQRKSELDHEESYFSGGVVGGDLRCANKNGPEPATAGER